MWGENRTNSACPREIVVFSACYQGWRGRKEGLLCNNEKLCLLLQWRQWEHPGVPEAWCVCLHDGTCGWGLGPRDPLTAWRWEGRSRECSVPVHAGHLQAHGHFWSQQGVLLMLCMGCRCWGARGCQTIRSVMDYT